jgi:hypothetical protein
MALPREAGEGVSRQARRGKGARTAAGALKHDLVVEAKAELRHAREIALHLDGAEDLGAGDVALGVDHEIDALDDVEEDLVLAVFYTLCAPRHCVGDCCQSRTLDLEFVGFLGDVSEQSHEFISNKLAGDTDSCRILLSVVCG